jgi:hypothetical protein
MKTAASLSVYGHYIVDLFGVNVVAGEGVEPPTLGL